MTAPVLVSVGHNVRAWTTFAVKDATDAEIDVLTVLDSPEATALMSKLDEDERLVWQTTDYDDVPDYWSGAAEPSVVDVVTEDDGIRS